MMRKSIVILLIFVIVACGIPPATPTITLPTATVSSEQTLTPTPHPLAINVQNASQIKLQKTIGAGTVNDVVWSPNGDVIAIAQDFNILFYDSSSLQLIKSIDLWGNQIAFSPDGLFLIIAHDNHITIWNIEKKEIVQELIVEMERVFELLFNSTGDSLAILGISRLTEGDPPSVLEIWKTASWERVYSNREKLMPHMTFSPDGKTLAFISAADLLLIDSKTGIQQKLDIAWGNGTIAYLSDDLLLRRSEGDQLVVMDMKTLKNLNTIIVDNSWFYEYWVNMEKSKIIFPEVWDNDLKSYITQVWDIASGTMLYTLNSASDPQKFDFSPDGKLFVSAGNDGIVRVHDLETGETLRQIEFTTQLDEVEFVSANIVAGGYYSSQIKLWDIDSKDIVGRFDGYENWGNVVAVSTDQKMIAVKQDEYSGGVFKMETGVLVNTLTCPDNKWLYNLLFDGDNLLFECGNFDNTIITIMNLISGKQSVLGKGSFLRMDGSGKKPIMILDGNAINPFLAKDIPSIQIVDAYGNNTVFDINFNEEIYYLNIDDMEVSLDGKYLALLNSNSTILIWEEENEEYLYSLQGHDVDGYSVISDIALSPYGYLLVSAGYDQTIRLWDVSTGEQLAVLAGFANDVNAVDFSPDGRYLFAGCNDGRIYILGIE